MTPAALPKVSTKAWRVIRSRAAAAPSTKFTPETVASLLNMSSPKSAADNIVYPLRRLGLLQEDGTLTELGSKWRVDASYSDACQAIIDQVYPDELSALTSTDGLPNKSQVETWLQHKGFGASNARQMAATYAMIAEKKVPDESTAEPNADNKKSSSRMRTKTRDNIKSSKETGAQNARGQEHSSSPTENNKTEIPNLHLDIQIHIPADATLEQIDQIFSSMAKHLYNK